MSFNQNDIVNYLKNYGFVFANSEIYNGLANAWDYGPIGVLLKNNIKKIWWDFFVTSRNDIIGLDSSIIYNKNVWKASGHLDNFSDPLIDCKSCKERFRVDKLIEQTLNNNVEISENTPLTEIEKIINEHHIVCPSCQKFNWTPVRKFNLMFKTFQGVVEDESNTLYLRPETAQGIFIDFKNVQRASRMKVPFGIAQIGKAFRNEITPGNFIFRTREFEQMEIEYFINEKDEDYYFNHFIECYYNFLTADCNINEKLIRKYNHPKEKLSHYSKATTDYEFLFAHGWGELCGIANRGCYDLSVHQNYSKKDLTYLDPITNEKYIPHVIEPSIGVERLFYAIICANYKIEKINNDDEREVLTLPIKLCPYKVCVLPLVNKLNDKAKEILNQILKLNISATFDSSGSIGKRYRRQDAIGTMYCITIDFDTIEKNTITIRTRDDMKQTILNLDDLNDFLIKNIIL